MNIKETTAYRSEYLVIECPYCYHVHYLDVSDDIGEGHIQDSGRKMNCEECKKEMRVFDCIADY